VFGGWSDNDPAPQAAHFGVRKCLETQLVNEKPPASLLISNPNGGKVQPEKRAGKKLSCGTAIQNV